MLVPLDGRMVIHFIGQSCDSAALYHDKPFDSSNLSHEFLFARFAWAILKRAHAIFMFCSIADWKNFNPKTANDAPIYEEEVMGWTMEMGTNRLTHNASLILPGTKARRQEEEEPR